MELKWTLFSFSELSPEELYEIWRLREEVFVVEQNCIYQDADGEDVEAFHLCAFHDNDLAAYCRIYQKDSEIHIGRVAVRKAFRGNKLAYDLMKEAHYHAKRVFPVNNGIFISAQTYLKPFYLKLGYVITGEPYLEDGIPHIPMHKAID